MKSQLCVRVPRELESLLRTQAGIEGRVEADVIRGALELYLEVVSKRNWAVLQPDMIALIEEISQGEKKKPEQILREAIWSKADGKERLVHLETIIGELITAESKFSSIIAPNET